MVDFCVDQVDVEVHLGIDGAFGRQHLEQLGLFVDRDLQAADEGRQDGPEEAGDAGDADRQQDRIGTAR